VQPQRGSANYLPGIKVELVSVQVELLSVTMLTVLLYGQVPEGAIQGGELRRNPANSEGDWGVPIPSEQQLWDLCKYVGVSDCLVGSTFQKGWTKLPLNTVETWLIPSDLTKVSLARALLQRPDVLMLHSVGDGWSAPEQQRLVLVAREFLSQEGSELHRLTTMHMPPEHAHIGRNDTRTILWRSQGAGESGSWLEGVLSTSDRRLTLISPSHAELSQAKATAEPEGATRV